MECNRIKGDIRLTPATALIICGPRPLRLSKRNELSFGQLQLLDLAKQFFFYYITLSNRIQIGLSTVDAVKVVTTYTFARKYKAQLFQ